MKKYSLESATIHDNLIITHQWLPKRIITNSYFRHNVLLFTANLLAGLLAYLLHPFLAHIMGIQDYGKVAALIAFTLVLSTPTQIISVIAAKYASSLVISGDHAQLNDFIRRLTVFLLVPGVVIAAALAAASNYVASFFHLGSPQGIILLSLIFVLSFVGPLNQGAIQGLQCFGWFAAITLLISLLRLVLAIGFVLVGFGVNGAILGIMISGLLGYIVSFLPLRGVLSGPRVHINSLRSLWSYSFLAAGATAGIVVLFSIDTVLASHFLSARETGLYAALATIGRTSFLLTASVAIVMFPRVVALYERGESHMSVVVQALLAVLILSAVVEVMFFLAPAMIMNILYGQAFAKVAGQLPLYGMAILLLSVTQVLVIYFLAIGNRPFVLFIFLACVLQVLLIVWHHADIVQFVQAVLITNVALLLGLSIVLAVISGGTKSRHRT